MPLAEYTPKKEDVTIPGNSGFQVRGISLPDVSLLIDLHEYLISGIAEKVRNRKDLIAGEDDALANEAMTDLMSELIRESPLLVGHIISICSDEPDTYNQAMSLPITVQIDALTKIAGLTFTDMASVKKLAADVMNMVRGIIPIASPRRLTKTRG